MTGDLFDRCAEVCFRLFARGTDLAAQRASPNDEDQRALDKEPLREWMVERGFRGEGEPPILTDEVRIATATRYILLAEELTQRSFEAPERPASERVSTVLGG